MGSADKDIWVFRLFISKESPQIHKAVTILEEICESYLEGQCDIKVINVLQDPAAGIQEDIIATPTLLKKHPGSVRIIIGELTSKEKLLSALGIELEA